MTVTRALVAVALVLAGIAWVWGNPPSAAPDELTHYVKALGVAGGDLNGYPVRSRPATAEDLANLGALIRAQGGQAPRPSPGQAQRGRWMGSQTREFTIPSGLGVDIVCNSRGAARTMCLDHLVPPRSLPYESTPMGTYQPLPYVLPGLAARTAGNPIAAIRRARLVLAAVCLALIGLAALVIVRGAGGGLAVLGLVAAVTPAVLLISVTVNPSGSEISGAICFSAGLFSVTRPGGRWWAAWTAVGAGGVALAGSRSFGPLFVVATLLVVAALAGRDGLRSAVAPPRAPAAATAALVAIAAAFNSFWELTQQPHPGASTSDIRPGLHNAWDDLPGLAKQVVGVFGTALDVPLPLVVYLLWGLLLAGVVGLALRLGSQRERALLVGIFLAALASVAVVSIAVRPTGFPVQTRHVLPLFVLLPLSAGEVLRRHAGELSQVSVRRATLAAVSIAGAVHLGAWYVNARAWSGTSAGPKFLVSGSTWSPPGSWLLWGVLLGAAAAAYVGAAWAALSSDSA
jgi:hypothetical protein